MDDFDSEASPAVRSWEWLLDVPHRLGVAIEVVGPDLAPALPAAATPAAARLRLAIAEDETLRAALAAVMHARRSAPARVDGLQAMCFGLTSNAALTVARPIDDGQPVDEIRRDLEAIGSWLVDPIERALTKGSDAINVEPFRLASLRRILDEAASRGSARTVLGAFVEALGVWDEVRAFAYAATIDGRFLRYISPRGVSLDGVPDCLNPADLPTRRGLARLSLADRGMLNIRVDAEDVLVGRVQTDDHLEWLVVYHGGVDERERVRLALYADMLRDAMNRTLRSAHDRLVASILHRPPPGPDEPVESAAQPLAAQLMGTVDARRAALAMAIGMGRQVFTVGSVDLLRACDGDPGPTRMVLTVSDRDGVLTFSADRDEPFTEVERRAAEIGVAAVYRWLHEHVVFPTGFERRGRARQVDALFEDLARDAVRSGQHVSLAVLSFGPNLLRPGELHAGLVKIRDHIRSSDVAGVLSPTEIGVLLTDVPAPQAVLLSDRLKDLVASAEPDRAANYPLVGVSTWSPDHGAAEPIVASARSALRPAV